MKISIMGSATWGTALAKLLSNNAHEVTMHFIRRPHNEVITSDREYYLLPGIRIPDEVRFCDTYDGLEEAELVVFSPASVGMRSAAASVKSIVSKSAILVTASKGIERESGLRMSQVLESELGNSERICVLSGPSHAEEVALGLPTGCVVASVNSMTAVKAQDAFMNRDFRVYTSDDLIGVELCGTLKNIIAIAVGICDGLCYGDNTKAMLMTRGLYEMSLLGERLGGRRETFSGLAGVGDLIVTCMSEHSRNRKAGINIGSGMTTDQAMKAVGAVVEGYYAAVSAFELAHKLGLEMPIVNELHAIMHEGKDPRIATAHLMGRDKREELS